MSPVDSNATAVADLTSKVNKTFGRRFAVLDEGNDTAVIADTGGTTYDVSLVRRGRIPWTRETWIGQPFDHATLLSSCTVRNNATGVMRTAMADSAAVDPWVNWNVPWWDSAADSWDMLSLTGATNNSLLPWHGYLVWARTRNLTLIVPSSP